MSLIPQRSIMGAAATTAAATYNVPRSLLLDSSVPNYLLRTFGSGGNTKKWTWSGWFKHTKLTNTATIFAASTPSAYTWIGINAGDTLGFFQNVGGVDIVAKASTALLRDVTGWYHLVVAYDSAQATAEDRIKMYVNNQRLTDFSTNTNPTLNLDTYINASGNHHDIGALEYPTFGTYTNYFDGLVCELNFVNDAALTPSSFGRVNAYTNEWSPKPYTGAFGTTGFYLPFSDATSLTTLCYDQSGNGNNWVSTLNSVAYNTTRDVPTVYPDGGHGHGNYCTLSSINSYDQNTYQPSKAGQVFSYSGAAWLGLAGTQYRSSGKWYMECYPYQIGGIYSMLGVCNQFWNPIGNGAIYPGSTTTSWGYYYNGDRYYNAAIVGSGYSSFSNQIRIGIALDLDNGKIWFSNEGVWQGGGNPVAGTNPAFTIPVGNGELYTFAFGVYQNAVWANFGQKDFTYPAPTGFKTMNTSNLPEPTLKDTSRAMASTLYTGDGATTQAVTNTGFYPSLTWIKGRSNITNNLLADTVRGAQNSLYSDSDIAQSYQNQYGYVDALSSSGFTAKTGSTNATNTNANGTTYVAWQWAANGSTTVTNNDGTQQTTVCANPATGFSIVKASIASPGGSAITLGHGLGKAPTLIITKSATSVNNWLVYQKNVGTGGYMMLNSTAGVTTSTTIWNNTAPTSTVFTLGSDWTGATYDMVAYCWTDIPGYSKTGTYVGNGSTNGTFVPCGFRPKYVMYKEYDAVGSWVVVDASRNVTNVEGKYLVPDSSQAEADTPLIDFLSDGFKLRIGGRVGNGAGITHIFLAFAEAPGKYSLAR